MATNYYELVPTNAAKNQVNQAPGHAMVKHADRIATIAEIGRVAMDEVATNYLTAEQLAAQALTAAFCISRGVPQVEVSETYLNTLTHHFLQRMVTLTNLVNDSIIRHTFTNSRG